MWAELLATSAPWAIQAGFGAYKAYRELPQGHALAQTPIGLRHIYLDDEIIRASYKHLAGEPLPAEPAAITNVDVFQKSLRVWFQDGPITISHRIRNHLADQLITSFTYELIEPSCPQENAVVIADQMRPIGFYLLDEPPYDDASARHQSDTPSGALLSPRKARIR